MIMNIEGNTTKIYLDYLEKKYFFKMSFSLHFL